MNGIAETFLANPLAAGFGVAGLLCQLAWPLFRVRRAILSVQFGIGADYGAQYALLEAWSGAGIASIGALQTAVAFAAGDRPWLRRLGFVFVPVVAVVCYLTWSGVASLFALAACTLVMVGRMQSDTVRLRLFLLAAAPFGIGYDISVGALPALVGAVASAGIAAAALMREVSQRRTAPAMA